jgi:uncharacterized membrane protein HdeD (DUF308 family)
MHSLSRNWWALAVRGVLAILFGVLALVYPGLTFQVLVLMFGIYAFLDGVFALGALFGGLASGDRWWGLLLEGILGIVVGILCWVWPGNMELALVFCVAFWSLFTGFLEIATAFQVRRHIEDEWALVLSGLLSVAFGVLLLAWPITGVVVLAYLIGIYALIFGVLLLVLAFRLRGFSTRNPAV